MGLKNKPRERSALELLEGMQAEALQRAFDVTFEERCVVQHSTTSGEYSVIRADGRPLTKFMQGWINGFTQNHLRVCAFLRKCK